MAYRRYSPDYIRQEDNGSRSKVGIWQGDFVAARAVSGKHPPRTAGYPGVNLSAGSC